MTSYIKNEAFEHDKGRVTGVLLTNLGTPDAPTPSALRRFLKEFLWDPRVVEIPRLVWWLILNGVILRLRPKRSAATYAKIWTDEGSPLLAIAKAQSTALQQRLEERYGTAVQVEIGMRYGNPSIASALLALQEAGAQRIVVLPLYPQYSSSTTASTFDAISAELKRWRWIPELSFINHYHDEGGFIDALADSVKEHWAKHGQAERLLMSFHGTPKKMHLSGDPYFCQCHKTARLLSEKLELNEDQWQLCFQSRFGKAEWLTPYTDKTLEAWGKAGVRSVDVVCPGFSADCLETLEEMDMLNREAFLAAGGEQYHYIPALNVRDDHIAVMDGLVDRHLQAWKVSREDAGADLVCAERARKMAGEMR